jgi:hypothetical protein
VIGIIVALLAIGILTGRRKIFVEITIFVSIYVSLLALFGKGGVKLATGAILGGVLSYLLVVWFVDERPTGLRSTTPSDQRYAERSATVGMTYPTGLSVSVSSPFGGNRWLRLGSGLGVASQGAQHFGGGAECLAARARATGKITAELRAWILLAPGSASRHGVTAGMC